MKRCFSLLQRFTAPRLAMGLAGALALAPLVSAQAQNLHRQFPPQTMRGKLVVVQPPIITINGKSAQLSPGARIRGANNHLLLSGSLVGQELTVNYVRDGLGLVHLVWLLTPDELAQKMPGADTERNFKFASDDAKAPASDN